MTRRPASSTVKALHILPATLIVLYSIAPWLFDSDGQFQPHQHGLHDVVQATRWASAVEYFSGVRSIQRGFENADCNGRTCLNYDINLKPDSDRFDFVTLRGFKTSLKLLLHVKDQGLLWAAPPCGSWLWISRGTTGRRAHNILGDDTKLWVKNANIMAERLSQLILLASLLGVWFVVENPVGSLLFHHPCMVQALQITKARRVCVSLYSWGAASLKRVHLFGTAPWLEKLCADSRRLAAGLPAPKVRLTVVRNGRTYGNHRALRDSSAYPRAFGLAVADLHVLHCLSNRWSDDQCDES